MDRAQTEAAGNAGMARSLARPATGGRVDSTFTNGAVRGGATWTASSPQGGVVLMRVSPRRVLQDLQAATGVRVDARFGPETWAALGRYVGVDARQVPMKGLMEASLRRLYHQGQGEVVIPARAELWSPQAMTEVRGDDTYFSWVPLTPGGQPAGPAVEAQRPAVAAPGAAPAAGQTQAPLGDLPGLLSRLTSALSQPMAPQGAAPGQAPPQGTPPVPAQPPTQTPGAPPAVPPLTASLAQPLPGQTAPPPGQSYPPAPAAATPWGGGQVCVRGQGQGAAQAVLAAMARGGKVDPAALAAAQLFAGGELALCLPTPGAPPPAQAPAEDQTLLYAGAAVLTVGVLGLLGVGLWSAARA